MTIFLFSTKFLFLLWDLFFPCGYFYDLQGAGSRWPKKHFLVAKCQFWGVECKFLWHISIENWFRFLGLGIKVPFSDKPKSSFMHFLLFSIRITLPFERDKWDHLVLFQSVFNMVRMCFAILLIISSVFFVLLWQQQQQDDIGVRMVVWQIYI